MAQPERLSHTPFERWWHCQFWLRYGFTYLESFHERATDLQNLHTVLEEARQRALSLGPKLDQLSEVLKTDDQ